LLIINCWVFATSFCGGERRCIIYCLNLSKKHNYDSIFMLLGILCLSFFVLDYSPILLIVLLLEKDQRRSHKAALKLQQPSGQGENSSPRSKKKSKKEKINHKRQTIILINKHRVSNWSHKTNSHHYQAQSVIRPQTSY